MLLRPYHSCNTAGVAPGNPINSKVSRLGGQAVCAKVCRMHNTVRAGGYTGFVSVPVLVCVCVKMLVDACGAFVSLILFALIVHVKCNSLLRMDSLFRNSLADRISPDLEHAKRIY